MGVEYSPLYEHLHDASFRYPEFVSNQKFQTMIQRHKILKEEVEKFDGIVRKYLDIPPSSRSTRR